MNRQPTCDMATQGARRKGSRWCWLAMSVLSLALVSDAAYAHIKWFVEFDVADPPRPLVEVMNPYFLGLLAIASAALLAQ